jgi:hypothetical protein
MGDVRSGRLLENPGREAAAILLASSLGACVESQTADDEFADESAADGEDGKGDSTAAFTFYTVRADSRACSLNSPPGCGRGFFVARANRSSTQCGIEGPASQCKVMQFDWSPTQTSAGIAEEWTQKIKDGGSFIVRGEIVTGRETGTTLQIKELWEGSSPEAVDGVFALVKDNGVRCITAPCPSLTELKLNSNLSAKLTGLQFGDQEEESKVETAQNGLYLGGTIVVGYRDYDDLGGKTRSVNKFFTKVELPNLVRP